MVAGIAAIGSKIRDYPFKCMVVATSVLPPYLAVNSVVRETPTYIDHMDEPFSFLWALICFSGGLFVFFGMRRDLIPPIIYGLRLSAFGWLAYFALEMVTTPNLDSSITVIGGTMACGVSLAHASTLTCRYRAVRRSLDRESKDGP